MNRISQHRVCSLILVLAVPGLAVAMMNFPENEGEEVSIKELPESIRKALQGVDIEEIEISSVFEIEIEEDGVEIKLRVDARERLLGIEIECDEDGEGENAKVVYMNSIPQAARDALKKFVDGHDIEVGRPGRKKTATLCLKHYGRLIAKSTKLR